MRIRFIKRRVDGLGGSPVHVCDISSRLVKSKSSLLFLWQEILGSSGRTHFEREFPLVTTDSRTLALS
jgi:hypothetical protein